ncbi:hypothetical protein EDD17DRAFT_1514132 [Pisolithus thermaeus]|nr:hypothetical protein EDD17DRAFT_1514132 [Pisolithus thermaeus]
MDIQNSGRVRDVPPLGILKILGLVCSMGPGFSKPINVPLHYIFFRTQTLHFDCLEGDSQGFRIAWAMTRADSLVSLEEIDAEGRSSAAITLWRLVNWDMTMWRVWIPEVQLSGSHPPWQTGHQRRLRKNSLHTCGLRGDDDVVGCSRGNCAWCLLILYGT